MIDFLKRLFCSEELAKVNRLLENLKYRDKIISDLNSGLDLCAENYSNTKRIILKILSEEGLSPVESERLFNNETEFRQAIRDILNKCDKSAEIAKLKQQLYKFENSKLVKAAKYWNSRHTIKPITYKGRHFPGHSNRKIDIPLQLFVTLNDPVILSDVERYNLKIKDPENCNNDIFKIYMFTRENPHHPYKYAYDSVTVGVPEFWMFPFEIRYAKQGDCDDHSAEIASYLISAGVPEFRVRIVCGNVRGYNKGGHSTVYVLADDLNTWKHMNSTTGPRMIRAKNLLMLPDSNDSKDLIGIEKVWFSFNSTYTWSDFEGTRKDKSDLKKIGIVL